MKEITIQQMQVHYWKISWIDDKNVYQSKYFYDFDSISEFVKEDLL